jgi:hypothetical protein
MKNILFIFLIVISAVKAKAEPVYTLENGTMKALFDLADGSLTGLESKLTGWNIISDFSAGRSFEAIVKLKDGTLHAINGKMQEKPDIQVNKDELIFRWNKIKVGQKILNITFGGRATITDRGLAFSGSLDNRSDAVVEQLSWPFIGEISIPEHTDRMLFQYINYTKLNTNELYPAIPTQGNSNLPEHAFTLVHNTKQGLYLSSEDHELNEYIRCMYETFPTGDFSEVAGGIYSGKDNEERKHIRVQLKAARMLYLQPESSVTFVPVIITPYKGSWHAGADIYKKWRNTWFREPHRPDWVNRINSWQQLQINSSESRINFTIKDLPKYVDECKKYGVGAIQLTGWTRGGQDRGLPSHDLDPRLGTEDEFRNVIAEAEKKGVKILLFTKFTWADMTTDYYPDWEPHVACNIEGETCIHPGYTYNTYTQLQGINTRRFGIFCMMDDALREKLLREFQKCLDLGAPGMVYDENQHHAGTMLCFNPNHGHKIPGFLYKGADLLGREFMEMCKKTNPDFLMVGEGCYDLQSQYYSTYTRANYQEEPVLRYVDPEVPIACAVMDHFDKNTINMCLADRYVISYEPRNFKGRLSEFPRIMAYGKLVDDLRKKYSDYLWDAEFRDTLGADVSGKKLKHSVFVRKEDGKKAVVVYNTDTQHSNQAIISLGETSGRLFITSPEKAQLAEFNGQVAIEPQSVVVIIEK